MDRTELAAQVRLALASHAAWKHHLRSAIATGRAPRSVAAVRREDGCGFGAWLLGVDELRSSAHFAEVRELHLRFHEEAARVLQLALDGQRRAAERALAEQGTFGLASRDLEEALERWAGLRPG